MRAGSTHCLAPIQLLATLLLYRHFVVQQWEDYFSSTAAVAAAALDQAGAHFRVSTLTAMTAKRYTIDREHVNRDENGAKPDNTEQNQERFHRLNPFPYARTFLHQIPRATAAHHYFFKNLCDC